MEYLPIVWLVLICLIPGALVFVILPAIYRKLQIPKPKHLPLLSSSGQVLLTWGDWHGRASLEHPVRYFLTEVLSDWVRGLWYPVVELKHDFVTNRIRKWHRLDFRGSDYTGGQIPCADAILYASFALLVRFVEKEGRWIFTDLSENEVREELKDLYQWWKTDRQKDINALQDIPPLDRPLHRHNLTLNDQYMLSRLINVRLKMY